MSAKPPRRSWLTPLAGRGMNRLIGLVQVGGIPGNRARPITIAGVAYPGVRAASAALQCSCTRVYKLIDERRAQ